MNKKTLSVLNTLSGKVVMIETKDDFECLKTELNIQLRDLMIFIKIT